MLRAVCQSCGRIRTKFNGKPVCDCGGILVPDIDFKYREGPYISNYPYLKKVVSLGEVETPMVDLGNLKLKLDYFSPTFSYKDRGSKALISSLISNIPKGYEINEDSSGNAGASISAYGTAAGFRVNIFVTATTRMEKIRQIEAYGANIHVVEGSRSAVQKVASSYPGYYASHVLNPEFRDGMRQLSYEIFRQLGHRMPDRIFLPVSAGTLLLGVVSGLEHLLESGEIGKIPEIVAVQTEAVCPLCAAVNGFTYDKENGITSIADALVSREPILIDLMVGAVRKYGRCAVVSEGEILKARQALASKGFYVEYSSATVFAAYEKMDERESVLVLTGNGLKTM
ncbi:MAG: pyridoxal-phosphate dependent enzyme [Thermoplasmatales archaeon]